MIQKMFKFYLTFAELQAKIITIIFAYAYFE